MPTHVQSTSKKADVAAAAAAKAKKEVERGSGRGRERDREYNTYCIRRLCICVCSIITHMHAFFSYVSLEFVTREFCRELSKRASRISTRRMLEIRRYMFISAWRTLSQITYIFLILRAKYRNKSSQHLLCWIGLKQKRARQDAQQPYFMYRYQM